MKTIFSVMLSAVLFVTQTVAVCHADENKSTSAGFLADDTRLLIADEISKKGEDLQKIQDVYGVDAANREFELMGRTSIDHFNLQVEKTLENIKEEDARAILENLKAPLTSEKMISILSDKEKSAKSKLMDLNSLQNKSAYVDSLSVVENQAQLEGYKKTFSDIASQMRSRAWDSHWDYDDYGTAIVWVSVTMVVLFFAGLGGLITGDAIVIPWVVLWLMANVLITRSKRVNS